MPKFKVYQDLDEIEYVEIVGHLEGVLEADSEEDALFLLKDCGCEDYLDIIEDSAVIRIDSGDNEFIIEKISEDEPKKISIVEQIEKIVFGKYIVKTSEGSKLLNYRIDKNDNKKYFIDNEIGKLLNSLNVKYKIEKSKGYGGIFYAISWIENKKLELKMIACFEE